MASKRGAAATATLPATIHVCVGEGLLELSADATPATADATIDHLVGLLARARERHAALRAVVTEVGGGSIAYDDHEDVGDRARLGFRCAA